MLEVNRLIIYEDFWISACMNNQIMIEAIIVGAWRSLEARLLWEQEVGGSNPLAPTSLRSKTE